MKPLLQFRNVSHRFGERLVLDGINWQVDAGQHWAILGPNGSGKTTLLRIACGYLWPNAGGEVLRAGETLTDLSLLRRSIGWVSSSIAAQVGPGDTSLETVLSGRYAQLGWRPAHDNQPNADDFERARLYLAELGLLDFQARDFTSLSQGEQQGVLIARARMAQPWVILLDEPCAGLDPGKRERFLASLTGVLTAPDAPSLVLVTHHVEEIVPQIENTLILKSGRVLAHGKTDAVITEEAIAQLYDVAPPQLIERGGRHWSIWPAGGAS